MTTEYRHKCKDCVAEVAAWVAWMTPGNNFAGLVEPEHPKRVRPANNPGPRCTTHWRAKQKAVKAANHEKRVQDVYGLEKGDYARLYAFQGGLCALCRRATGKSRNLSVDHDHATGEVRGLLCRPCNSLLGHARDRALFFLRCIWYLRLPPYRRMKQELGGWPPHE